MDFPNTNPPRLLRVPNSVADMTHAMKRADKGYASTDIFNQLVNLVKDFERSVDNEHEVGILLATFGQAVTMQVQQIGCLHPVLILFDGILEDGTRGRLIQHSNQLNFLLTKLPRANPEEPRRPIGFTPLQ